MAREFLNNRFHTDDERALAARALDLAERASRGAVCFSDFLSPAERSVIASLKELRERCEIRFEGGYDGAERVRAVFRPAEPYCEPPVPITALHITVRGGSASHRDILGSVIGLGITRAKLGDIVQAGDDRFVLICDSEIASYINNNLERAGRCAVTVTDGELADIPAPRVEEKTATVMSLRLDSVCAEGFGLSRTAASELIKGGCCFVNWVNRLSPSHPVAEGDTITLRGRGRIRLARVGGESRKGRTFITVERFV